MGPEPPGFEDDTVTRANARIGTWLKNKYRLDRILGIGGMATVYAATHRNQAELAVKLLHPDLSARSDVRTRFLREGYVANSVKHTGAVLVVDDDIAEDGSAFLVMELLRGTSLEELCDKHGRLPAKVVTWIGYELLDIVSAAHAKSIVHRDIKPPNVFLTEEGTVKVLDFGIAQLRNFAQSRGRIATQAGMLLGTPGYMAPEQALGQSDHIGATTDVWAVGATLFKLLSGRHVHEGDNAQQLLILAATARAHPLSSVAPDVPPALAQVVDRALAFEKSARWPTATAMREALRDAALLSFSAGPSRDTVFELLGQGLANAPTAPLPAITPPHPVLPGPSAPMLPGQTVPMDGVNRSGWAAPAASAATTRPMPATTGRPVMSERVPSLPTRSIAPFLFVSGGIVALAMLVAGAFLLHGRHDVADSPPAAAVSAEPTVPASTSPPPPVAPAISPPEAPAATHAVKVPPTARPTASTAATPTINAPSPSPPVAAHPAKPDCAVPYTLDAHNNKKWKLECLSQ